MEFIILYFCILLVLILIFIMLGWGYELMATSSYLINDQSKLIKNLKEHFKVKDT